MTVLTARGSPLERDFSFGVVQQLFAPLRLGAPGADRELLDGAAALALRALGSSRGDGIMLADASFATLHGLYWLVANVSSETPALLLIDDCHWADGPSLRFLAFVGARLDGLRVVVVTTRRTGDPTAEPELLREVRGLASATLHPALLGPTATATLVRRSLGEHSTDRFCDACHDATGGNPLLVQTLASALTADGVAPERRGSRSGRPVRSRCGRGPSGAAIGSVSRRRRMSSPEPWRSSVTARRCGRFRHSRGYRSRRRPALPTNCGRPPFSLRAASCASPIRFCVPQWHDAMGEDERALAHAEAAAVLAADGAPPDRLALHLIRTHPVGDPRTAATLQEAARLAVQRGAVDTAGRYLVRALAEPPPSTMRGTLQVELGLAYLAERRDAEAIRLLADGVTAVELTERPAAALLAGRALGIAGHFVEAAAVLESAVPGSGCPDRCRAHRWKPSCSRTRGCWPAGLGCVGPGWALPGGRLRHRAIGRELMRVHLAVRALGRAPSQAPGVGLA